MQLHFLDLYLKQLTGDQEALPLSNQICSLELIYIDGDLKGSSPLLALETIILKLCPIVHFWLLHHPKQKGRYPGDPVRKADLDVYKASPLISFKVDND